jgi:hypothetical protein
VQRDFHGEMLNALLEQKARRYRDLARQVMDDASRNEIEKLASEYEMAARVQSVQRRPIPAA